MSRLDRLLELAVTLQYRTHFTAQQLADEMGVSRRTILRDLQTLQLMGVPLTATPGPHGGYDVDRHRRLVSLALTVGEASGIVLAYDSFARHAQSPFARTSGGAITKLRAALPPDVLHDLDRIEQHVAVLDERPRYAAPFLEALLDAALARTHLRVRYDGRGGTTERTVFPFGVFAQRGFWYCACWDVERAEHRRLRADRVVSLATVAGPPTPPQIPMAQWFATTERDDGTGVPLRARVSPRGLKHADIETMWGTLPLDTDGWGILDTTIPRAEVAYFAARLIPLGADVVVLSPPELIAALRALAAEITGLYEAEG